VHVISPFISISNAAQATQVYDLSTTRTFRFRQATESAFLAAVESRNIFLKRGSLRPLVVQPHLKFHVPETGILQSIELFIYALVRPTELPF
jgi:hypothetical protein